MNPKRSPLAPEHIADLPPITGVRLGSVAAGIKYRDRTDLCVIAFDRPARIAGVFTQSRCPAAPVDWCRKLQDGQSTAPRVRCIVANSGNANAFTGEHGARTVQMTVEAAARQFGCNEAQVFVASTGVIGEPMDASKFADHLAAADQAATGAGWLDAARAIMTTDTYPKVASVDFKAGGVNYRINGIAKGSGMIAPNMATMLAFLVTDLPVDPAILRHKLGRATADSFNAITVDSDTSTNDTVLLASTAADGVETITDPRDVRLRSFARALNRVSQDLAMQIVRDGEGASKLVEIVVEGAKSKQSARKIAFAVANSPLVKTAVAGEDANWGRIVGAVGKAGEPADRDRLSIWFADIRVAHDGARDPEYDEEAASAVMRREVIPIRIDVGVGRGRARVWTCDLSHGYIDINADYRS